MAAGKRFFNADLNRVWSLNGDSKALEYRENEEKAAIFEILKQELNRSFGSFIFLDLYTTSSPTIPFITINDSLINRDFSKRFPVPIILGIEEYLNGPLLSFINELGHTAVGFESGQHDAEDAIYNAEDFLHLALCESGCVACKPHNHEGYQHRLAKSAEGLSRFYEILYRHEISSDDQFVMNPGFQNF